MNTFWRRRLGRLLVVGWMGGGAAAMAAHGAEPPPEIVVATRYFQQTGTSHAHLYLYLEDGKLLRQLTNDEHNQDHDPVFAPDGVTVVFARSDDAGNTTSYWSVEPRGGNLHLLTAAPDWYQAAKSSPSFGGASEDEKVPDPPRYESADGRVSIVLNVEASDDNGETEGHGKHYVMNDEKSKHHYTMGDLPGYEGLEDLLECPAAGGNGRFLIQNPLRAAFFDLHLNSTDGDTVFALDIAGKRLVRLSPNYAEPFPLPGEAGFLTLTEERYVPFGDGKRTANSSYLEHWDAAFHNMRYAREKAAARCVGASMYRPGKTPAVITIRIPDA